MLLWLVVRFKMPDLGNYTFHVLGSYGATSLLILLVIIWSYIKHDQARKTLLRVEEKVNEK
mgnify:CR=1 FL=1